MIMCGKIWSAKYQHLAFFQNLDIPYHNYDHFRNFELKYLRKNLHSAIVIFSLPQPHNYKISYPHDLHAVEYEWPQWTNWVPWWRTTWQITAFLLEYQMKLEMKSHSICFYCLSSFELDCLDDVVGFDSCFVGGLRLWDEIDVIGGRNPEIVFSRDMKLCHKSSRVCL